MGGATQMESKSRTGKHVTCLRQCSCPPPTQPLYANRTTVQAGGCTSTGIEGIKVWHWVSGRHHAGSQYNGREPTFQSENQMIDSDTRVTARTWPTTGRRASSTRMHCFAGRGPSARNLKLFGRLS
jgi:hypothetical protein